MSTLFSGGGYVSAPRSHVTEKPMGARMFRFEEQPHDDGTSAREAMETLVGKTIKLTMPCYNKVRGIETLKMKILKTYPAFFIARRTSGHLSSLVVCINYSDISNGTCTSDEITAAIRHIEVTKPKTKPNRDTVDLLS